jgi:hypothetical protein
MSKYTDEQYLNVDYFQDDEEITNYAKKIVTTRKEHSCSSLGGERHPLPSGSRAILESAIQRGQGFVSNYLCLPCADGWPDVTEAHFAPTP